MKLLPKVVPDLLALTGIALMLWSVVGRFVRAREVMGGVIPDGIAASSAMIGANTLLLLAVLAHFYKKD